MEQKHKDSLQGKLSSCSVSTVIPADSPLISIKVIYPNGARSEFFLDVTGARSLAANISLTLDQIDSN